MVLINISLALSSVKGAIDIAKSIKDGKKAYDEAQIKKQLVDLISILADAKVEIAEMQQLLLEKDKRISELEAVLEVRNKLIFERPFYYSVEGEHRDGPFCQQCWDKESKLIRHQEVADDFWECKTCKSSFFPKDYQKGHVSGGDGEYYY